MICILIVLGLEIYGTTLEETGKVVTLQFHKESGQRSNMLSLIITWR